MRQARVRAWTAGYQGQSLGGLVALLRQQGIARLVDVRQLPLSRKRGFSKGPLREALAAAGIGYEHVPGVGAPKPLRDAKRAGQPVAEFHRAYARHLRGEEEAVARLEGLLREAPSLMLCFEADPGECHRAVLSRRLRRDGFEVVDLRPGDP